MAKRKRSARPGTPEARETDQSIAVAAVQVAETPEEIAEAEAAIPEMGVETGEEESPTEEVELPRQNVTERCEQAKEAGACACRCRGKYHGNEHPAGWKLEPGCEPLSAGERKAAKAATLKAWRHNHPERVSTYMKQWRQTSNAPTAVQSRMKAALKKLEEEKQAAQQEG